MVDGDLNGCNFGDVSGDDNEFVADYDGTGETADPTD
jgi:hypothetical protein